MRMKFTYLLLSLLFSITAFSQNEKVSQFSPCVDDQGNAIAGCITITLDDGRQTYALLDSCQCIGDDLFIPAIEASTGEALTKGITYPGLCAKINSSFTQLVPNDDSSFYAVYPNGDSTLVNIDLECCPETVTTLVDNGDGTYTYTNEDGSQTVISSNETLTSFVIDTTFQILPNGDTLYNYNHSYTDENGVTNSYSTKSLCPVVLTGTAQGELFTGLCENIYFDISNQETCSDGSQPRFELFNQVDTGFIYLNDNGSGLWTPPNDLDDCPTDFQVFTSILYCGNDSITIVLDSIGVVTPPVSTIEALTNDDGSNYDLTFGEFMSDGTTPTDCDSCDGKIEFCFKDDENCIETPLGVVEFIKGSTTLNWVKSNPNGDGFNSFNNDGNDDPTDYMSNISGGICGPISNGSMSGFDHESYMLDNCFTYHPGLDASFVGKLILKHSFCENGVWSNISVDTLEGGCTKETYTDITGISSYDDGKTFMLNEYTSQDIRVVYDAQNVHYSTESHDNAGALPTLHEHIFDWHATYVNGRPIFYVTSNTGGQLFEYTHNGGTDKDDNLNWNALTLRNTVLNPDGSTSQLKFGHADKIASSNGRSHLYFGVANSVAAGSTSPQVVSFQWNGSSYIERRINLPGAPNTTGSVIRVNNPASPLHGDLIVTDALNDIQLGEWDGTTNPLTDPAFTWREVNNSTGTLDMSDIELAKNADGTDYIDSNGYPILYITTPNSGLNIGGSVRTAAIISMQYNTATNEYDFVDATPDGLTGSISGLWVLNNNENYSGGISGTNDGNVSKVVWDSDRVTYLSSCLNWSGTDDVRGQDDTKIWGSKYKCDRCGQ